jgi:hypothetical protein
MYSAPSSEYSKGGHQPRRRRTRTADRRRLVWPHGSVCTPAGAARGLGAEREQDRVYRATMRAVVRGHVLGRGRHGVVVGLTDDPDDPWFNLAVKIVSKVFVPR